MQLITEDTFRGHQGFDLATFEERNLPATELPTFRVLKNELFLNFKARVANQYNLPEESIRLWVLVNRQNKTVRPDTVVPENDPNLSELFISTALLLLRVLTCDSIAALVSSPRNGARPDGLKTERPALLPRDPQPIHAGEWVCQRRCAEAEAHITFLGCFQIAENNPSMMIFLKFFDISRQTLLGVARVYVQRNMKVGDLVPTINELMRWPPTTQIKLFEVSRDLG